MYINYFYRQKGTKRKLETGLESNFDNTSVLDVTPRKKCGHPRKRKNDVKQVEDTVNR